METGIEIVTGAFLLVFGFSFLINSAYWCAMFRRLSADSPGAFTLLMLLLICGTLMVMGHNLWVADWRIIVTITGWAMLLESVVLILVPRILEIYSTWSDQTMTRWLRVGSVLWTLAGAIVLYFGLLR